MSGEKKEREDFFFFTVWPVVVLVVLSPAFSFRGTYRLIRFLDVLKLSSRLSPE